MDRRTLLKLSAAMALTACSQTPIGLPAKRVVLVGAGIVGASIAYHLAQRGVRVTVIDKLGPATQASRGTFAWINATWAKQPRHYHAFNQQGVATWASLREHMDFPLRWGGSLEWFTETQRQQRLVDQIAEQVAWGEPARMIDEVEFAQLEPDLVLDGAMTAAYSPNDGAIDPVMATRQLLEEAARLGAKTVFPCAFEGVSRRHGRLTSVQTSEGSIPADHVVLATGAETGMLPGLAGFEVPQRSTPGVIALTRPMPRLLNRIIVAPGVHMHQRDDGRIVLGEQEGAPQNAAHAARLAGRPNEFPSAELGRQHARRMLDVATNFCPGIAAAEIESVYIGWRPLPLDGHPVIGSHPAAPDLYIAVMHSGVTLAPIVGQLAAHEIANEVVVGQLDAYRPTRSFENVKRYG